MKRKLTILLTIISFLAIPIAAASVLLLSQRSYAADAGSCYAIGDSDQRNFCLAKARKEPGQCYAIQSQGLRAQCLAEVRK